MKLRPFLSAIVAAALAHAATAQTTPAPESAALAQSLNRRYASGIVAAADGTVITVADVIREVSPLLASLRESSGSDQEYQQRMEQLVESVVRNMLARAALIREFRQDATRQIPESYVDAAVADELTQRFGGDRSKFLEHLRAQGKTIREFRRDKEDEIIYSYMRNQRRTAPGGSNAPPALQNDFATTAADDGQPAVHLRMIKLTRSDGETDIDLNARADQVLSRFNAGEKFDALAREFTADARRDKGGDWGWLKRSSFKQEFADIAFALNRGEVSAPILLPEGAFILFVEDRK